MTARVAALALLLAWPWQAFDDGVRQSVQDLRRPGLETPMHALTNFGRPLLVVGAAAALLGGPLARVVLGEVVLALVPVNLVVEGLKRLTDRPRPDGEHKPSNAAFPSSHAANAFAIAAVISRRWPRAMTILLPFAALVAFSRVYLDRHWASDVILAAVLGAGLALATLVLWSRARATRNASRAA